MTNSRLLLLQLIRVGLFLWSPQAVLWSGLPTLKDVINKLLGTATVSTSTVPAFHRPDLMMSNFMS